MSFEEYGSQHERLDEQHDRTRDGRFYAEIPGRARRTQTTDERHCGGDENQEVRGAGGTRLEEDMRGLSGLDGSPWSRNKNPMWFRFCSLNVLHKRFVDIAISVFETKTRSNRDTSSYQSFHFSASFCSNLRGSTRGHEARRL